MKVIIVDDEPLAISVVEEYLKDYDVEVLATCLNGFEAMKAIQEHQPDLIFLDIQMPKINGFELLEILEAKPKVIFATAFDEFAIKAFEHQAVDYLLKPFTKERFAKAMANLPKQDENRVEQSVEQYTKEEKTNRIVVKDGQNIKIIPAQDVVYLEAYDDYVKIHTTNECYLKKHTLSKFENSLPLNKFVKVHRSFIINVSFLLKIEQITKDSHRAVLKNDEAVQISRSGYAKLKQVLGL
jgi:two-component system LytT family response regulator